ncbi:MAG: hypothetical protein Q8N16_03040 [bacterium]|nr:hypothetical protein [bacterium]
MSKKGITIFALILISILVLGTVLYLKLKSVPQVKPEGKEISETAEKPSERMGKFSVSGGEIPGPAFEKELIVDPLKPKLNEIQKFSIWAKDPKGIKEVTGEIETDNKGKEKIGFKLVEGRNEEGRWFGSWQTKDVSSGSHYSILILAKNEEGKETKLNFPFEVQF